ncbi:DUF3027 domain-containing protein [Curtobacterium herbarum]|uniref:DUF3027 domain-containing protein n=1 Tax=Curtobacterium herbarum TaxID=150122 RepID=A0ABN1ZD52_9MICO|nr:DUF3027 domain-containing protein [Curtobacterium herbarum]MBM7474248.1 hypothetical protein [Curtobacterium herbarum]MCS6546070.1 DUF3027 domain-containing protein [Curtobacterium herbarum]
MTTDLTELARGALLEITPEATVGSAVGTVDEGDGVVSVLFANRMPGYPGWRWTVSIAQVEGDEPTVLEVELMPGDGSLLAPEWVPWSERLADYRAAQDDEGDEESDDEDDEDDDFDDDQSDDEDDDEDDESDDEDDDDESEDDDEDDVPPPPARSRRRTRRVRPVDPDDDLDLDQLDVGEVDPGFHRS